MLRLRKKLNAQDLLEQNISDGKGNSMSLKPHGGRLFDISRFERILLDFTTSSKKLNLSNKIITLEMKDEITAIKDTCKLINNIL